MQLPPWFREWGVFLVIGVVLLVLVCSGLALLIASNNWGSSGK